MSIELEFTKVFEIAQEVRKSGVNGRDAWMKIEAGIIDKREFAVRDSFKELMEKAQYNKGDTLDLKNSTAKIEDHVLEFAPLPEHFFIQLFRLPNLENKISYTRLMQVAYNAGQFSVSQSPALLFFKSNNMDKLSTYVNL